MKVTVVADEQEFSGPVQRIIASVIFLCHHLPVLCHSLLLCINNLSNVHFSVVVVVVDDASQAFLIWLSTILMKNYALLLTLNIRRETPRVSFFEPGQNDKVK